MANERRVFVKAGLCWALVTACERRNLGAPIVGGTDTAGSVDDDDPQDSDAGTSYTCDAVAEDSWAELSLEDYPELAEVGGWVTLSIRGTEIVVAQVEDGCFVAMKRACSHEGEAIEYRHDRLQMICPRHGATYALDGTVRAGPAPRDLEVYDAAQEGDSIWVEIA